MYNIFFFVSVNILHEVFREGQVGLRKKLGNV